MPRQSYSWEDEPPPRRRRIWRWLLLVPLLLMLLGAAVAAVVVLSARSEFMTLAGQYDLSRLERMESASLIYDRKGDQMGKIFIQNRDPVPYEKLSPWLVKAVVAAEDQRFWEHTGVDYWGIVRAAQANWTAGRIRQGASTVTQQLARNSFDLKERTYRRKLLEMALAVQIEKKFPKEKIMEMYLNRVYFGGGLYGAEAAARGYFGVSAAELTASQAATLAGLLKSPNSLSPCNRTQGLVPEQYHLEHLEIPLWSKALVSCRKTHLPTRVQILSSPSLGLERLHWFRSRLPVEALRTIEEDTSWPVARDSW
jgi:penicillin-binding protein 1A